MTASKEVFRAYLQSQYRKVMSFQQYLAEVVGAANQQNRGV